MGCSWTYTWSSKKMNLELGGDGFEYLFEARR